MGSRQSKIQPTGSKELKLDDTKLKSHQTNLKNSNSKKERRIDSVDSDESSDNESFSFVVKHKTHEINLKKGLHSSSANHAKSGNNNLDWDSIISIMNNEINEGLVIIRE
ncbi:hypothetical protein RS030_111764 [Cryptosporidium xiaoi]|uniref:Uncharacterized protein n=1 Tax=Cryptosporidium xiaoi TaxID=659607 RepID=A0AAV9Y2E6_9CRYT